MGTKLNSVTIFTKGSELSHLKPKHQFTVNVNGHPVGSEIGQDPAFNPSTLISLLEFADTGILFNVFVAFPF
uniref:Uncharacterized protein n=1 Tax=Leptospira ellisii TaxID=2023197 RepID=A0A2N0B2V0_9LEPT|nr:hypothetical protein CH379_21905 [Leptospira ellisii]